MNIGWTLISSSSLDTPDTAGEAGEVPGSHGLQAELLQHEALGSSLVRWPAEARAAAQVTSVREGEWCLACINRDIDTVINTQKPEIGHTHKPLFSTRPYKLFLESQNSKALLSV